MNLCNRRDGVWEDGIHSESEPPRRRLVIIPFRGYARSVAAIKCQVRLAPETRYDSYGAEETDFNAIGYFSGSEQPRVVGSL